MTDVFISYSRRDKVFTQKLVEALIAAKREVWADWASIPAASDWDAEIKEGIEKTDTVLFVLSPEWLKSNECRKEMDHALKMGKRLLPILHIMPDQGQQVPPELARLNWVYMREGDNFEKAFEILCGAMDTDLDWVKTHTRIQVRAIEWDKKNRDNSLTLRGNDLTDGEQFISQGLQKSPEPTQVQSEFILASRKDATRRQRVAMAGITIALVISVALGVVAYFQRQAAVLNSKISFARELTAASQNSLTADPELSILLALQATQILSDAGQDILPSTENALRDALQTSRVRNTVKLDGDSVLSIAFSPDGRFVAAGTENGSTYLWNISNIPDQIDVSGQHVGLIWLEETVAIPGAVGSVKSVTFSPDGKYLASSTSKNGNPSIWSTQTGEQELTLDGNIGFINKIAFSPDGNTIATAGEDGMVRIWDASNGTEKLTINEHDGYRVTDLSFSPDGQRLASGGDSTYLILSDVSTGETLQWYQDNSFLNSLAFSSYGNLVAFGNAGYNVKVIDLNTDRILNTKFHKDWVSAIAFSPDGNLLASVGLDGKGFVIDPNTGKKLFTLSGDKSDILAVAFSPDGKYLATGNNGGEFKIWDASVISSTEAGTYAAQNEPSTGLALSTNGKTLVTSGDEPVASIIDVSSGNETELYESINWINDVAINPNSDLAATGHEGDGVIIWNTSTGEKVTSFPDELGSIKDVEFSTDGKYLTGGGGYGYVWDMETGGLVFKDSVGNGSTSDWIWASTFSPDGKYLAIGGDGSFKVGVFDLQSGQVIHQLEGHQGVIRSLAFSPDGSKLLSGSFDSSAILWDVKTGELLHSLNGHIAGITNVAFSPDGLQVATSSSDGSAKIWDVSSGELLYTLTANKVYEYFWVNNVAFSQDGKLFATGSEDGVTRFYYTNVNDVLSLAQARITRSLTEEECVTYLHLESCPENLIQPERPATKPAGAVSLQPTGPFPQLAFSDSKLRSGDGSKQIFMDFRNKSSESLELYWIASDGVEQKLGNMAPSEVISFQSNESHAFRVRDLQKNIVYEYVANDEDYQQINIKQVVRMGINFAVPESAAPTDGIKSGEGSTEIWLEITNGTNETFSLNWVNFDGAEESFTEIIPGVQQVGSYDTHVWRIRDAAGNLILEYVDTAQSIQYIKINADRTVSIQ